MAESVIASANGWAMTIQWTLDYSSNTAYVSTLDDDPNYFNTYGYRFQLVTVNNSNGNYPRYNLPAVVPFGEYVIYSYNSSGNYKNQSQYLYFPPKRTVSYNNGGRGTTPESHTVQEGSSLILKTMASVSGDTYTVSYNTNGADITPPNSTTSKGTYIHYKWAEGSTSGTRYNPGAEYYPTRNVTMYGIWQHNNEVTLPQTLIRNETSILTIKFDANGGTNTPDNLSSIQSLVHTNWNTKQDGSGVQYLPGNVFSLNSDLTLYASWSPVSQAVTLPAAISRNSDELKFAIGYRLNGGDSQQPADQTLIRTTPYTFGGWNTNSTGTGTNYAAGASYSPTDDVTTLYAKWTTGKTTGSVIIADAPTKENTYEDGFTATLDLRGGKCEVSSVTAKDLVQWKFLKWSTTADGTGTSYYPGDVYTTHADIRLHAQWGKYATIIPTQLPIPKRSGYAFVGWGFTPLDEEGVTEIELFDDIILYAIWVESYSGAHYNNNGTDTPCLVYYNNNGVAVLCDVYYNRRGRPMKT